MEEQWLALNRTKYGTAFGVLCFISFVPSDLEQQQSAAEKN